MSKKLNYLLLTEILGVLSYNSIQNLFLLIYDHTYRENFHHNLSYSDISYLFWK